MPPLKEVERSSHPTFFFFLSLSHFKKRGSLFDLTEIKVLIMITNTAIVYMQTAQVLEVHSRV